MVQEGSMERWGKARQGVLEAQKGVREQGQVHLAKCREGSAAVVISSDEPCFNQRWGECVGKPEFCMQLGVVLCGLHHEQLHVVTYDVGKPQPQNPYNRPAAQIRWALQEGHLILWCKCGEPYYPSHVTEGRDDGAHQMFTCPNGHRMEVVAHWKEKESVASAKPAVAAAS